MTRKFLSAVAVMAAVFFTGSIAAEAADVTFGGQLRTRGEFWNTPTNPNGIGAGDSFDGSFIDMRVRLNTKVKIDENTSAFIQFQSVQRFGSTSAGPTGAGGGGGTVSNPRNVSNPNNDVGLHELKLIVDLIQRYGINGMWRRVSETARYGGLTRGPMVMNQENKEQMKKILKTIQDGTFNEEWISEYLKNGKNAFDKYMKQTDAHQIEQVGKQMRKMMWPDSLNNFSKFF